MANEVSCTDEMRPFEQLENIDEENTIKILMATDIHLGFEHNRDEGPSTMDSFVTFEEILRYAHEEDVDFILLGGDLFHDAKPSQMTLLKSMELLRNYCFGPKDIKIQFLSDPAVVFDHCEAKVVNYEDPNLNVSIPIFSIHGNHDDPSLGATGTLDLLSATGMINYFGKHTDLDEMKIKPLIIAKGESKIAIYGLGHVNDKRLSRLLNESKIELLDCQEEGLFKILVLHQNRVPHTNYDYIPQKNLPEDLDLVMWGHEHECRIDPEFVSHAKYFITQPGSSIATSLSEGESITKHVGVLEINGTNFRIKKLPLKTVRPFIFEDLFLRDVDIVPKKDEAKCEAVLNFVKEHIENEMIPAAEKLLTGHPKQPAEPLIRLRVYYDTEDQIFDLIKFGQIFCDKVHNPMDIVLFRKSPSNEKRTRVRKPKGPVEPKPEPVEVTDEPDEPQDDDDVLADMASALGYGEDENDEISSLKDIPRKLEEHFNLPSNKDKMRVLSVYSMNEALRRFVELGDVDAFSDLAEYQANKAIEYLETCDSDFSSFEDYKEAMKVFVERRNETDEMDEIRAFFESRAIKKEATEDSDDSSVDSSAEVDDTSAEKIKEKPKRGRGSRGGTASSRGAGSKRGTVGKPSTSRQGGTVGEPSASSQGSTVGESSTSSQGSILTRGGNFGRAVTGSRGKRGRGKIIKF